MQIINAQFLKSSSKLSECEEYNLNEVAFLGRSNVGKSSLINTLTNNSKLAKKSQTPGKTRLINFFEVSFSDKKRLIFVDLPGFGYAKVSKSQKEEWNKNLEYFVKNRGQIKVFLHLIDARHDELSIDENLFLYVQSFNKEAKYIRVFTKIDKLNQSQMAKLKNKHKDAFFISSLKKSGFSNLLEFLAQYGI
ncbi:ribosome biogenesis GTP-binding protein YihA/YsxC [Campylobacter canadensis]|uniref:Probable GTP-binding protein EngB n=1 Tax=Campylobacter canadensis TaxID=449520 RepID=A0ABS7WP84_9BACT|nr:ribosome biogenesis GTP-binding protein YihA/YsxC [Campylobacter canadensis]MBZ7986579.1 YihA family ribosome biogenesis GTP-binding protein [Campylobacter canadensis]MBZ7994016.1 YihA family ribosome biogenesis GTP-binding protein [Campylobacter canadensis]MBZ7995981.1 YihA family ribosome biogenesis GTP-binding protein [Campylobacter canadensis]MBZ7997615.1 YihA family ribosome biogenesis GTP-binding protein [Campylobacter canadensis]MBZ7999347.1 YihA family ribosome biogenesis GTP-bindin